MQVLIEASAHVLEMLAANSIRFTLVDRPAAIQEELDRGARYRDGSPKKLAHLERLKKLRSDECGSNGMNGSVDTSRKAASACSIGSPSAKESSTGNVPSPHGTTCPTSPTESEAAITMLISLDGATRTAAEKAVKRAGNVPTAQELWKVARTYLEK